MIKVIYIALMLIIIFSISFVSLFWKDSILLTFALLIMAIFSLSYFHTKTDFIVFTTVGIVASFAEAVCIYFGAWNYTNPTRLIPLWLPILWGLAAIIIRRFSLEVEKVK
jgi:hypothetical protein